MQVAPAADSDGGAGVYDGRGATGAFVGGGLGNAAGDWRGGILWNAWRYVFRIVADAGVLCGGAAVGGGQGSEDDYAAGESRRAGKGGGVIMRRLSIAMLA